jgi:hypothetical protein
MRLSSSFTAALLAIAAAACGNPDAQETEAVEQPSSIVTSGNDVAGTVVISAPAPAGGAAVQLRSSNDFFNLDADLPAVVTVPAGATSAPFTVRTHLPSAAATFSEEMIVANYFGGAFQGAPLTIVAL